MDETPRQSTPETPAPPGANGALPVIDPSFLAEIAADARKAARAIEEVDVRLQAVQVAVVMLIGFTILVLVLEARQMRRAAK